MFPSVTWLAVFLAPLMGDFPVTRPGKHTKTMDNYHLLWVIQRTQWQFSSSQTVSLPEGTV